MSRDSIKVPATSEGAIDWAAGRGFSILMDPHAAHKDIGRKRQYYVEKLTAAGHSAAGRDLPVARLVALGDTAAEIVARRPDIIIGSWCGKKFRPERVRARPGFADVPAVLDDTIYEIKSPLILQPGPAALTDGLAALQQIIERWAEAHA